MKTIKRKILFYKSLLLEIVETLRSICLYLDFDGTVNHHHNPKAAYMRDHFEQLGKASAILKNELSKEAQKNV